MVNTCCYEMKILVRKSLDKHTLEMAKFWVGELIYRHQRLLPKKGVKLTFKRYILIAFQNGFITFLN